MNKTKISIKHRGNMFRFETRCRSSYDARMWRLLVSEWFPACDGETLLKLLAVEEVRVQAKIAEVDKIWLEQNAHTVNVTLCDMQDFIAKRLTLRKRGKKFVLQYGEVESARYMIETVTDARNAVAGIATVFRAPANCPNVVSALVPHLLRQRVFELLHEVNMLGIHRLFDTVVLGRGVIA